MMRTPAKIIVLALVAIFSLSITSTSFAALNSAIDGGGAFTLLGSTDVDITPLGQPQLMKAVYNGANCIASSNLDPLCGTGTNASSIPRGTVLTFVIYMANDVASSITLNDVRFNDELDPLAIGGFTYVANSLSYGSNVLAVTWANARTTAFLNNAGTYDTPDPADPVYYDAAALPEPTIYAGGTGAAGNNATVNIAPGEIFAIAFDVTLN